MSKSTSTVMTVTRKLFGGLVIALLVLGLTSTVYAQQSTGNLRGIVSGADSGVVVEVVNASRGVTKSREVASDGSFQFQGIEAGTYDVRVISDGEQVDSQTVNVVLGQTVSVVMGTTAAAIEEIIVTGARVAQLDTSIAESGLVITFSNQVSDTWLHPLR